MPGGGVKLFNIYEVVTRTGCRQIHVAAFTSRRDDSTSNRPHVTFGGALQPPENRYDITDRSVVARLANTIRTKPREGQRAKGRSKERAAAGLVCPLTSDF
jgi:copper homeostasis protein